MNLRLVRMLPAFAPRPAFEREDRHVDAVLAVTFVPGSTDVIAISRWGIQRFALDRDEPVWRTPASARWSAGIAMSPDGERLLTVDDDTRLVERDAYTGAERWCWDEKLHHTKTLVFSDDGNEVLWCGGGVESNPGGYGVAAVMLYDVATQTRRWRWEGESWTSAQGAALGPFGVLVAQHEHRVTRLRRDLGTVETRLRSKSGPLCGARDGRTVLVGKTLLVDETHAESIAFDYELAAIDPDGSAIAVAPYWAPRFHAATFEPFGSATIELADADLDRVTSLACADQLVAVGTNGGHTFIYGIV